MRFHGRQQSFERSTQMLKVGVVQDRLKRLKILAFAFRLEGEGHLRHYPSVDEFQEERGQIPTASLTRRTIQLQRDDVVGRPVATLVVGDGADIKTEPTGKCLLAFTE